MVEQPESEQAPPVGEASSGKKRDRTLIEFPYADLARSVELAHALHGIGGQAAVEQTQLAVAMDQSAAGGTFRGRLSAARMFGVIKTDAGSVQLTPLGLQIIDDPTSRAAKAEAFLRVPLYAAMYERYNGFALPPAAAIGRQMQSLGVPPKQVERARQAFASSAATANYIALNGRFSKPALAAAVVREDASDEHGGGGGYNPPPPPPPITDKALEYKLVDLMREEGVDEAERAAIWTLLQYLTAKAKKTGTDLA